MEFTYIKTPLNRYTFSIKPIREWVEKECGGKTLNLFAGKTKLNVDEVRNDLDKDAFSGKVTALPRRTDVAVEIDEQLIIELYSK